MDNKSIFDSLKTDLVKLLQEDSVKKSDLKDFLASILKLLKESKSGFDSISAQGQRDIQSALQQVSALQKMLVSTVDAKNSLVMGKVEDSIKTIEKLIKDAKKVIPERGLPGKDADEELIVEKVLEQIKLPEYKEAVLDDGEEIVQKINDIESRDEKYKIDAKHIKNLPTYSAQSSIVGSPSITMGNIVNGGTSGSVLFVNSSGQLGQDNANFFWDNAADQLQIGPSAGFDGNSQIGLSLSKNVNNYAGIYIQNKSTGDTAGTDLILGADNDNVSIAGHYIDIGIQGSGFLASGLGIVKTATVTAGGSGYTVGDILTISTGDVNATVQVLTRTGTAVATVSIVSNGTNYTTGTKATTGGTGTGCTINITSLYDFTGFTANDGYVYTEGGHQLVGTDSPSKIIKFFTAGGSSDNIRSVITDNGLFIGGYNGFGTNAFGATPVQYSTGTASRSGTTITGIGTTFTSAMVGSHFTFADGTDGGIITVFTSTTSLAVSASGTVAAQKYRISYPGVQVTNTGLVGVGNTTPEYRLDLSNNSGSDQTFNEYIRFGAHNTLNSLGGGLVWKPRFTGYTKTSAIIASVNEANFFRSGLAFYTNGTADATTDATEKMRITSAGSLGIGTNAPGTDVEILYANRTLSTNTAGDSTVNLAVMTNSTAATDVGGTIGLGGRYSGSNSIPFGAIAGRRESSASALGYLSFSTFNSGQKERMRIDSSGNIGIGISTSTSKLDILPTGTFGAAGVSGITIEDHTVTLSGANPTTYATFRANEMGQMTLIGTNAGQTVTDASSFTITGAPIKSTNVAVTNTHALRVIAGAVSTATNSYGLTVNAQTGATNNYTAAFLGGNVGVGTSAPASKLHVGSTSGGVSTGILLEQLAENGGPTSSYVSVDLKVPTTGITGQIFATANNYVNASTNFAANGIGINASATGGQLVLAAGSATGYISFDTGGVAAANERMRILANGNVGIGTTAPFYKLHSYAPSNSTVTSAFIAGDFYGAVIGTASTSSSYYALNVVNSLSSPSTSAAGANSLLYVRADGNVGIGTSSPTGLLSLAGSISAAAWTTVGINLQTAAATYTDTSSAAAATVATRAVNSFGIPTLAATNTLTAITNASNIYIAGAPVQSATAPITNTHALYIAAGAVSTATNSYGLTVNAQTGATNNHTAAFLGGNVGMGTATPTLTTKLQLIDTSSGTSIFSRNTTLTLQNTDTTTNNWTGIGNYSPSGSVASGISFQNYDVTNSYSNISFTTRGATGFNRDVMTIKDVNVGIGTTAPSTSLDVSGTTGLTVGVPTASVGVETGGMLFLRRRDTSITANVNLGRIDFTGDDAVAVNTAGASIRGYAETTWTNTDNGSRIAFYTVANTTTTLSERMRIDNAGLVGIGVTPGSKLHTWESNASAGSANGLTVEQASTGDALMHFLLTGVQRWTMGIDNSDSDKFKIGTNADLGTSNSLTITSGGLIGAGTSTPTSTLHAGGSFAKAYRAISALRTLDATDYLVDCTGTFTVTLPTAVGIAGREYVVRNASTGTITIATTSAQTINAAATQSLSTQYSTITLMSDGANWMII